MKTFRFVLLLFLVLSISNTAWAQNQTVKGRVIDSKLKRSSYGGFYFGNRYFKWYCN